MPYEYDVFISYPRRAPAGDWVRDYFSGLLRDWLSQSMDREAQIFFDRETIETGDAWPERLRRGLAGSRYMVAVWTPPFFRSRWCMAEFLSMRRREHQLRLLTQEEPAGLIFPVTFHDGESFPPEAKEIQSEDFKPYAYSAPFFRDSRAFMEFEGAVKALAERIATRIERTPAWRDDFPLVEPDADDDPPEEPRMPEPPSM